MILACRKCDYEENADADAEIRMSTERCPTCGDVGTLKCAHDRMDHLGGCEDCGAMLD